MVRVPPGLIVLFLTACAFAQQNPAATVTVDVQSNRHSISPLIYGVNLFESSDTANILEDLNAPINRYGGNRASTYNWQLNSDNRGNDFFFESITDDAGTIPARRTDDFITNTKGGSSEPMVTVPMLNWIAKSGTQQPLPCSYPRNAFPTQDDFGDQFDPDCGDGLNGGAPIDGADPTVALVPNTLANQQAWVQHTTAKFNTAANGGLKYYILDNEHDLWPDTHHDAVATAPHYNEDTSAMLNYAGMIKAQDSGALVAGPEASGWLGYIYSPFDNQDGRCCGHNFGNDHVDHDAVGDYLPWFLSQFKAYADAHNGQRLLDYFTVHYYPQGGDNNSNTRSLWDPNFVDPSFIGDTIMLIPRMKQWVADNYPGTKIGITEYNWAADLNNEANTDSMLYAVTQADVLGIFGREGLDLATRFNAPIKDLPSYNAMKMYRNYDGQNSTFGDVSVSASSPANPDNLVAFAAQRTSDNKVTIVLLNKYSTGSTPVTLNVANFTPATSAQRWQLSGTGTSIQTLANVTVQNGSASLSLPAQSITLVVLSPQQQAPPPGPVAMFSTVSLNFGNQILNSFTVNSTVALTNSGTMPLNISKLALVGTGLFQVNNCPRSLAASATCFISLKPTTQGPLSGTLTLTDDAADSPQSVAISGAGFGILLTPRASRSRRLLVQGTGNGQKRVSR